MTAARPGSPGAGGPTALGKETKVTTCEYTVETSDGHMTASGPELGREAAVALARETGGRVLCTEYEVIISAYTVADFTHGS